MESIVPLLPVMVLGAGLTLLVGSRQLAAGIYSAHISLSSMFLAFAFALYALYLSGSGTIQITVADSTLNQGEMELILYSVDSWSGLFACLALAAVAVLLLVVTRKAPAFSHRNTWMDVFLLAMALAFTNLVYSATTTVVIGSWICLGLVSFTGSLFATQRAEELGSAHKALAMTCLSGGALLAVGIVASRAGGQSTQLAALTPGQASTQVFIVLAIALVIYAGQYPLHHWATELGRMPSSFAATSVIITGAAAVYLLGRFRFIFDFAASPTIATALVVIGLASMLYGGVLALNRSDINTILRSLVMIELGYAFAAFGLGTPASLSAAAMLIVNLVLSGGAAVLSSLELKSQGISDKDLPVLRRPIESALVVLACGSLLGVPPLLGAFAKWMLYGAAIESGYWFVVVIGVAVTILSAVPMFKAVDHLLFSRPPSNQRPSALAGSLSISAVAMLQLPALAMGVLPWLSLQHLVSPSVAAIFSDQGGIFSSALLNTIDLVGSPLQLATYLAVILPFGIALALYPFPIGRSRLYTQHGPQVGQEGNPSDHFEGMRAALEMGAISGYRLLNPESELSLASRAMYWMGTSMHAVSLHIEERYYFAALLLLAIAMVFVFIG